MPDGAEAELETPVPVGAVDWVGMVELVVGLPSPDSEVEGEETGIYRSRPGTIYPPPPEPTASSSV